MKKVSTKTLMVFTILVASFTATPMMVAGYNDYEYNSDYSYDQFGIDNPMDIVMGFSGGFGSIFRGLGYGGNYIGLLFEMLLMQTLTNFSSKEVMDGVFVLSASIEKTYNGTRDYSIIPETEIFMLPYEYNKTLLEDNDLGQAYCEVTTSGTYEYTLTVGAAVTLIIWDNDKSFVNAIMRLIDFFNNRLRPLMEDGPSEEGIPEDLIREGVELITWFLIHINDIFTGEELFILNPITWQKMEISTGVGFSVTKEWKVTENDWGIDDLDPSLDSVIGGTDLLIEWNNTAKTRRDSYMEWLLTITADVALLETVFTSFTFDLIQLWIKNFYISIDVAEIMNLIQGGGSGMVDVAKIFKGLDIEFYLFTHHLTGAFLYNDTNSDNKLSANYVQVNQSDGVTPILVDGRPIQVPRGSELTHRIVLGTVADYNFMHPTKNPGESSISWGLTMDDAMINPVPVGVDLDSYLGSSTEFLEYIHFGFTFEPRFVDLPTTDGGSVPVLHGAVKLDQEFAPWNAGTSPPYNATSDIAGLDLAIVYVSTVLHFHLKVDTIGDDPDDPLNPADDYNDVTHSLKIGNYLPRNIASKLDFVDIAGEEYLYGAEGSASSAAASTNILPIALFEVEAQAHKTFEGSEDVAPFAADIGLNITFSTLYYAVCFPEFEDGTGIWHDPTFSVFMVFDAKGFWALILLIAGVGFVGIATILIKRRKDARF